MQKYEYRIENLRNKIFKLTPKGDCPELTEHLNSLGREGWELVGATTATLLGETQANTLFFKRPLA